MSVALERLAAVTGGSVEGDARIEISDVTHDSRSAGRGVMFVAVRGYRRDGHDFVAPAVEAGSPAACVERRLDLPVAQLVVADARRALSALAAEVHGHASRRLRLVGVTGTNGKTTVCYLLESIGRSATLATGLMGTIETRVQERPLPNDRTTPEASDFQRLLAVMARGGAEMVAVEVSSHALALGRVDHTHFSVVAFTNLGHDHLDFHGTIEAYEAAKASLFSPGRAEQAVVFTDDPAGRRIAASTDLPLVTVSVAGPADVFASDPAVGLTGSSFRLHLPDRSRPVRIKLGGAHNITNALVAAGCGWALGIEPEAVFAGLEGLVSVPGRLELVSGEDPVTVMVDYAHTPEGIATVVAAARDVSAGRIIVVVGAGGDRDRGKRPAMGRAASRSDLVVVTSDNPRSEDPDSIIEQVAAGIDRTPWLRCPERRQAVRTALAEAVPGDVVLILGKGHEQGQEAGGVMAPFDDRTVVRQELAALRGGAANGRAEAASHGGGTGRQVAP